MQKLGEPWILPAFHLQLDVGQSGSVQAELCPLGQSRDSKLVPLGCHNVLDIFFLLHNHVPSNLELHRRKGFVGCHCRALPALHLVYRLGWRKDFLLLCQVFSTPFSNAEGAWILCWAAGGWGHIPITWNASPFLRLKLWRRVQSSQLHVCLDFHAVVSCNRKVQNEYTNSFCLFWWFSLQLR